MNDRMQTGWWGLLALASAAIIVFVPMIADPYMTPKLVALGLVCLFLLVRRSPSGSSLTPHALGALLAWAIAAVFSRDRSYTMVGSYISPFDGLTAVTL